MSPARVEVVVREVEKLCTVQWSSPEVQCHDSQEMTMGAASKSVDVQLCEMQEVQMSGQVGLGAGSGDCHVGTPPELEMQ